MKYALLATVLAGLVVFATDAQVGPELAGPGRRAAPTAPTIGWTELPRSFGTPARQAKALPIAEAESPAITDIDVVDAHWMALTMWGEARGQGEAAMRAVGHVIDNRRKAGRRRGSYVTETVNEAWQFSCWNAADPNRAAIERIDLLAPESREYRLWRAARRVADEILAGRSVDPTGGALFYHAESVSPAWSRGIEPVARIGGHLFFRAAR